MVHDLDPSTDAELIRQVIKSSTTNLPVPGLGHIKHYMISKTDPSAIVKVWTR